MVGFVVGAWAAFLGAIYGGAVALSKAWR
jgi:hypothetical protein